MSRLRILISNDDGITAEGIRVLARSMSILGEVFVVAPDRPRSAAGHGITLHKPIHVAEYDLGSTVQAYSVNGTPADCIKVGINAIMADGKPDLVLSGINAGANLGTDVLYSGTVSAAAEGVIQGIPAIAVSISSIQPAHFEDASSYMVQLVQYLVHMGIPKDTLLNVNVPDIPTQQIKDVSVTKLGVRKYDSTYEKRIDPLGRTYYWLAGNLIDLQNDPDTDVHAITENKISISPIRLDLTNRQLLQSAQDWQLPKPE